MVSVFEYQQAIKMVILHSMKHLSSCPSPSITMPAIQPGSKVLVTGANGYVAVWVIQILLDRGYSVRGTVRSANKGEHLTEIFSSYGSKFELTVVEDIAAVLSFLFFLVKDKHIQFL
jgi:nucleoside-diphosphate-sugar epimerase